MVLPPNPVGWSEMCDCGISWLIVILCYILIKSSRFFVYRMYISVQLKVYTLLQ